MTVREIEEKTTITRKRIRYTCDICGLESFLILPKCFICGKDICENCWVYMPDSGYKLWEGNNWCCKDCWEAGKDWREYLYVLNDDFNRAIEEQMSDWRDSIEQGFISTVRIE